MRCFFHANRGRTLSTGKVIALDEDGCSRFGSAYRSAFSQKRPEEMTEHFHIEVIGIKYIGKEANRFEEQFFLGEMPEAQIEYMKQRRGNMCDPHSPRQMKRKLTHSRSLPN